MEELALNSKKWSYLFLTLTVILGEISVYFLWETNNRWYLAPIVLATISVFISIYYLGQNQPQTPTTYVRQEYNLSISDHKSDDNNTLYRRLYKRL